MSNPLALFNVNGPRGTAAVIGVAIVAAGVLLVNLLLGFTWLVQKNSRSELGQAVAGQAAESLRTYVRLLHGHAVQRAKEPGNLLACIGQAPVPACAGDEFPGLDFYQFVPLGQLGIASPDFSREDLHGHVEVDLAGEIFRSPTERAEVVADKGKWMLIVGARVEDGESGTPAGVLLLRASVDALLEGILLSGSPPGEFTLVAGTGAIATAGATPAEGAETYSSATVIPALQVAFRPDAGFLSGSAISYTDLLLPAIGGTVLLLVVVFFGLVQMRRQLLADAKRLTDAALYQRASTLSGVQLYFAELDPVIEAIAGLRRRVVQSERRQGPSLPEPPPFEEADPLEIEAVEPIAAAAPERHFPPEVFRDYDIRGRTELLAPQLVYELGLAIGTEALEHDCSALAVGADARISSPALQEQLMRGLTASGIDVIDVGTVATPLLYFACQHLDVQGGVMVTGSHNGPDQNGFKIMLTGETLCGERIQALRTRMLMGAYREGAGNRSTASVLKEYRRAVCDDVLVDVPLKVVVDCANGAASVVAVDLLEDLGCEVIPLFCELDGQFPNHAPDPSVPGNLRALLAQVAASKADLGIAYDGDGDRIGVVTANGRILTADRLMMLFAREVLSRHPGSDVVFDVKCSRELGAEITRSGGRPVMWKSGHSWIKQKMKDTGALLGGEFTGHICFRDRWYGFDDALYCTARLLEILSLEQKPLDELVATLPECISTSEIFIAVPEQNKTAVMEMLSASLSLDGARLTRIDGLRAEYRDGWGLVRASNTSAALTLRFEGRDEVALARIQSAFREALGESLPGVAIPF